MLKCSQIINKTFYYTETGPNKLTVGKIFGGMLILENWKLTRFMPIPLKKGGTALPVSLSLFCLYNKFLNLSNFSY